MPIRYIVNGITLYRLAAAPVLLLLIVFNQLDWFKWLLPVSFLSDALDGYLARKYKKVSLLGSRLDSIADDLTIVAAVTGLFLFRQEFVREEFPIIALLLALHLLQTLMAVFRYGKISSFHTYLAKTAAVLQALFFVILFFTPQPLYGLFYTTALLTGVELQEEIILVMVLPKWEANVKGLYWVLKRKKYS